MLVKKEKPWDAAAREPTAEDVYLGRRRFIGAALAAAAAPTLLGACKAEAKAAKAKELAYVAEMEKRYPHIWPAKRNPAYTVKERPLTKASLAEGYNNFYEFTTDKPNVKNLTGDFQPIPWTVKVHGLCEKPKTFDLDDLVKGFDQEERIYRHRCVEAWAMTVPWTGFPLKKLLEKVKPLSKAKFVRFKSVARKDQMPGVKNQTWYPWPYFEALRIDEATHPLCLVVTGLYGKPQPKQNGAPVRIATPWKYGYKSPKLIVEIELIEKQPNTFWHQVVPNEYGFYSNVNPHRPHPRWSQATERLLGEDRRVPTQMYNGYAKQVAHLYPHGDPF